MRIYWYFKSCLFVTVGTSSSGRARSDPTHQHHSHLHVHSHSAHHGGGTQFPTMECESPAGSQVGSTAGGTRSQYQQQQSWPPEASQGQSSGHLGTNAVTSHVHLPGHRHHSSHHHHVVTAQSPPSLNASVPSNLVGPPQGVLLSGSVLTSSEQVVYGTRTGFPASGMSVDMVQAGHHSHPNIDPSLNMQLQGYPQQYGQYTQQTWQGTGFPFALTSSSGGTEPPPTHARTVTERSDDSPMVGVIVQQSPVVIHWWWAFPVLRFHFCVLFSDTCSWHFAEDFSLSHRYWKSQWIWRELQNPICSSASP